jgi:putative mRNA 3-end processing factor
MPGLKALKITNGNGIEVCTEGSSYLLDPKRTIDGSINVISHAHSDHLPRGGNGLKVISTEKTIELAFHRTGRRYYPAADETVELFEAGHIPGSAMTLIRGEGTCLYTGDFCTRRKVYLEPAVPRKTDCLVIETTYGRPDYVFPDPVELSAVIRDWVSDAISHSVPVFFPLYPLGKAQEIEIVLRGLPLYADETVRSHNRIVFGETPWIGRAEEAQSPESVFICSSRKSLSLVRPSLRKKLLTATVSGWAIEDGFRRAGGYDEAFPLSDHCDYNDLMNFVDMCGPERVYTVHGFADEFAASVRRELGIEALPLRTARRRGGKRQSRIDNFVPR